MAPYRDLTVFCSDFVFVLLSKCKDCSFLMKLQVFVPACEVAFGSSAYCGCRLSWCSARRFMGYVDLDKLPYRRRNSNLCLRRLLEEQNRDRLKHATCVGFLIREVWVGLHCQLRKLKLLKSVLYCLKCLLKVGLSSECRLTNSQGWVRSVKLMTA